MSKIILRGIFAFLFFFIFLGCINKNKIAYEPKSNNSFNAKIETKNTNQGQSNSIFNKYSSKYTMPCNSSPNCCQNNIINFINNSQSSIILAVYSLTNNEILNAIIEAKKRGVDVKVVIDRAQENIDKTFIQKLKTNNIDVRFKKSSRVESNKFAIFDSLHLVNGSYSWNNADQNKSSESCMIDKRPHIIGFYKSSFDELWLSNSELDKRDIVIATKKVKFKKKKRVNKRVKKRKK